MSVTAPATRIADERVPVNELLGVEATRIVAAALHGAELRCLQPVQARYRPDRSVTVGYRAGAELPSGEDWDGMIVAHAGGESPPEATVVVSDGRAAVSVWRFPDDPWLPGLRRVLDPRVARSLLEQVGQRSGRVTLRTVSYRPRRRAVVEVGTDVGRLFVKVTSRRAARDLQHRHTMLAGEVPVPRSLGWSEELGAVVLEALPGMGMRELLRSGAAQLPSPGALVGVLDRFPSAVLACGMARRPVALAAGYARFVSRVVPDVAEEVTRIVGLLPGADGPAEQAVHGDFHPAQVLVGDRGMSGLVDVDSAGAGWRVDDLATMLGNLSVIVALGAAPVAERYLSEARQAFEQMVDPVLLHRTAAAAVLGYATGPFRTCDPVWPETTRRLLQVAASWVDGV